jgi:hypothetical protein
VVTDGQRERFSPAGVEPCLVLRLARSFYVKRSDRWEQRESDVFSFTSATFEEI